MLATLASSSALLLDIFKPFVEVAAIVECFDGQVVRFDNAPKERLPPLPDLAQEIEVTDSIPVDLVPVQTATGLALDSQCHIVAKAVIPGEQAIAGDGCRLVCQKPPVVV